MRFAAQQRHAIQGDAAAVGRELTVDQIEGGGFACAVRPDECEQLARSQIERHIVDRLVAAKSEKLREKFGIAPGQTVVLYAPTWRDDAKDEQGNWATVNNLQQVKLPTNFTLLYRGHTNTVASERKFVTETIDVTEYPDVTDLYLLADVLVTDYSSVMFDFSVTGKPLVFLCPDLAEYQALRGFYFDFENEAPGPILKSAAEVVSVLKNLDKSKAKYAQKYKNWRKKFNRLEDGKASARVVDAVFHA